MKLALKILLCISLGYVVLSVAVAPKPADAVLKSPVNVFLITIDTLRADHVGCYGYRNVRTPALDGLANDGIRFANAFTPSPITNTSHASILTGVLPSLHGVTDFGVPIAPGVPTLAEILKEHGYATAAFIGAVILDSTALAPGFDRGFDYYDNFPANLPPTASRYERLERRGIVVVRHAEKWLLNHKTAQRFVWLHLYDPHDPYDPPLPYSREYAGRLYDGEIAYADSALGSFIAFLKRLGIYDESAIVVVGDHGEGLGEHGEETHGIFLYDSTTHVPLIFKPPRRSPTADVPKGLVIATQVQTLDIFPTILDLEGIPFPDSLNKTSLHLLWSSDKTSSYPERAAPAETDYPIRFGWAPLKSVRTAQLKYIEAPRPEFYVMRSDPQETQNLYEPWNEDVQKLRAMIAELRNRRKEFAGERVQVSPQTLSQLKALGYLGSNAGSTTAAELSLLPDPKDKIEAFNFIHRAMLSGEEGDTNAVRRALASALRVDPSSAVALGELGRLELARGNFHRAAELLSQLRQIRPGDPTVVLDEARARFADGDTGGARDVLEATAALGQYDALCLLGQIYTGQKDWDKARDHLQAAVRRDPSRSEAYIELARLFLDHGDTAGALRQLREAASLSPKSPEVFALMSRAYLKNGEKTKAEQAAQRARSLKANQ